MNRYYSRNVCSSVRTKRRLARLCYISASASCKTCMLAGVSGYWDLASHSGFHTSTLYAFNGYNSSRWFEGALATKRSISIRTYKHDCSQPFKRRLEICQRTKTHPLTSDILGGISGVLWWGERPSVYRPHLR